MTRVKDIEAPRHGKTKRQLAIHSLTIYSLFWRTDNPPSSVKWLAFGFLYFMVCPTRIHYPLQGVKTFAAQVLYRPCSHLRSRLLTSQIPFFSPHLCHDFNTRATPAPGHNVYTDDINICLYDLPIWGLPPSAAWEHWLLPAEGAVLG